MISLNQYFKGKWHIIRTITAWVLVLVWMGVIFSMSAETVEESKDTSTDVSSGVASSVVPDYGQMTEEEKNDTVANLDIIIRKLAHFSEFALLGVLIYAATLATRNSISFKLIPFASATAVAVLYAASDEIHQYFVPGRMCLFKDFVIDACGAITGTVCLAILMLLINLIIKRRIRIATKL